MKLSAVKPGDQGPHILEGLERHAAVFTTPVYTSLPFFKLISSCPTR